MKKLRILALTDESLVPPEDAPREAIATADWKMEYDVVHALRQLGHTVVLLGVGSDLGAVRRAVQEQQPHIVFNLLEDFHDVPIYDQNLVSYLELLRVPYTGCNPRGLILARDKALSKTLISYHRIPVPGFHVFPLGRRVRRPRRLRFPLIVKSLTREGSAGIAYPSIVDSDEKLAERVRFVHEHQTTDAIAESYIDGREIYVGILGNHRLEVFPPWELFFKTLPDGAPRIATDRVKWNPEHQKKRGITTGPAKDLPDGLTARIEHLCKRVYRILQLNGYARIDLRLDASGQPYVLEANPNPHLDSAEDFAQAAKHHGIAYDGLMQRIVQIGLRWERMSTGGGL